MELNVTNGLPQTIVSLMQDGTLERYGSHLVKGGAKIVGHFEQKQTTKAAAQNKPFDILGNIASSFSDPDSQLTSNVNKIASIVSKGGSAAGSGNPAQIASSLIGNVQNQKMISQLSGISSQIGGIASLGWANMALSAVNLGATVVSTVVICKKMNKLSEQMTAISGKLDFITEEIHQIYGTVRELKDNEIRKLYTEASKEIQLMNNYIYELNSEAYTEYIKRDSKKALISYSSQLENLISRYCDSSCGIMLSLDTIMSYFYAYISFLKTYISVTYLNDKNLLSYQEFQNSMRMLCSSSMLSTIESIHRTSAKSFISAEDLRLIKSLYKGILAEQISGIKSQNQILGIIPYNEYVKMEEQLKTSDDDSDIAFIEYQF